MSSVHVPRIDLPPNGSGPRRLYALSPKLQKQSPRIHGNGPIAASSGDTPRSTSAPRSARIGGDSIRYPTVEKIKHIGPECASRTEVHTAKDLHAVLFSSEIADSVSAALSVLRDLYRTKYMLISTDSSLDLMKGYESVDDLRLGDIPNVPIELARGQTFQTFLAEIESSQASVPFTSAFQFESFAMRKIESSFTELETRLEKSQRVIKKLYEHNSRLVNENLLLRKEVVGLQKLIKDGKLDESHACPCCSRGQCCEQIPITTPCPSVDDILDVIEQSTQRSVQRSQADSSTSKSDGDVREGPSDTYSRVQMLEAQTNILESSGLSKWMSAMQQAVEMGVSRCLSSDATVQQHVQDIRAACWSLVPRVECLVKQLAVERERNRLLSTARQQARLQCADVLKSFLMERDRLIYRCYQLLKSVQNRLTERSSASALMFVKEYPAGMHPEIAAQRVLHDIEQNINDQIQLHAQALQSSVDTLAKVVPLDDVENRLTTVGTRLRNAAQTMSLDTRKILVETLSELSHRFRVVMLQFRALKQHSVRQSENHTRETERLIEERALLQESLRDLVPVLSAAGKLGSSTAAELAAVSGKVDPFLFFSDRPEGVSESEKALLEDTLLGYPSEWDGSYDLEGSPEDLR